LQLSFALAGQERLAAAQVGLRFYSAPRLEVLAHTANRRYAKAAEGCNLNGGLALFIELQNPFTHRHRDGFHAHTFASCQPLSSYIIYGIDLNRADQQPSPGMAFQLR
jgi:hypothetical protein